jgi:sphinganine-1-phosphate aldolase
MHKTLPAEGRKPEEILAELRSFGVEDPDYRRSRVWSLVYYLDPEHEDFLAGAYQTYSSANGLNPLAFKSLKRLEDEIVSIGASLFHAPDGACGMVTSGGTESCLLAVKTYRDRARANGVSEPEMIIPASAHVAWRKGAEYFGLKLKTLPLAADLRADVSQLEGLITPNTAMILGSAPDYPHGTIDPIAEMAAIAERRGAPMHVDACVGGFILPFMEMNGRDIPLWDYRVPGVTSISADLHKYGFAAKGASTITYRRLADFKHQMFVAEDWPGGVFASPGLLGTRPGVSYAAAWSALQYFGVAGYRDLAARTAEAVDRLSAGIAAIPGLRMLARPQGPLIAYAADDPAIAIFSVADRMEERGWAINRLQHPEGLHGMVTARHLEVVDAYLADLRASVEVARARPELARQGSAAIYGMIAHAPAGDFVRGQVLDTFASYYATHPKRQTSGHP